MSHAVIIKDAVKKYGDFTALKQVNLEIQPGEFFTLLGPSGCRKDHASADDRRLQLRGRRRDPL